jgi:hypothetical protein
VIPPSPLWEPSRAALESFTKPIAMYHQIHTSTELRQQIHDDLRIQHPEWVEPNGECPRCDSYEWRLTELLDTLTAKGDPKGPREFSPPDETISKRTANLN